MPRKKDLRRFDPRCGVSESMLDAESVHVGQEFLDYMLMSISDLRQWLGERQSKMKIIESSLSEIVSQLPDRERLAIRCMLIRDFWHIAKLYERFLRKPDVAEATGAVNPMPEEMKDDEPESVIPFSEFLFDPERDTYQAF